MTPTGRRKLLSSLFVGFCAGAVLLALIPLALILFFVISRGILSLNLAFFTHMPTPVGEAGGGMANSIVGTLMLSGLAALMAVPIGVISGIYMSEYAGTRFAAAVRFAADTLNGVPSIVIGVFVYGIADKKVGGIDLQMPNGNIAPVFAAALDKGIPAPFNKEPTGRGGNRMHAGNRSGVIDEAAESCIKAHHLSQPVQGDFFEFSRCRRRAPQHRFHIESRAQ
jgi:hypothetical protein